MDWNISRQNAATVQLIFLLYMQMDAGRKPRTRDAIIKILQGKGFSPDRIGYSLNYLVNDKMAYQEEGEDRVYRLTSTGVHWVEYNFDVESSGDNYTFYPRHKSITIGREGAFKPPAARSISNRQTVDWTK